MQQCEHAMEAPEPDSNAATAHGGDLKHYLQQCLGEGGFGQVFEAWDSKLCCPVAIKRLKNLGVLPNQQALIKEARLAASLHHAAFVKIHALEDDEHSQAIVMELVHGQTLKQVLAERGPSVETALDMVQQIAQAMQEAHAAGLTHGDLKPSNLMLEASGRVRILDFGLASQADLDATTSMLEIDPQGTIAYMAPERLLGAALAQVIGIGIGVDSCCIGCGWVAAWDEFRVVASGHQTVFRSDGDEGWFGSITSG
jgi:serine/threonine-protein kinase